MNGDIQTLERDGKWINVIQGQYDTQAEAQAAGMKVARTLEVEWFGTKLNGQFGERNTYGHDPRNTKG